MKIRVAWLFLGAVLAAGCGRQAASGPPAIRYGQDNCGDCGMTISDDRFAAALVNPSPDASPLLFDDVGCMLAYERKNPEAAGWRHYFHDAQSHQWITGEAFFVKTSRETPMGSGIVAAGTPEQARAIAESGAARPAGAGGDAIRTYQDLLRADATASAAH